MKIALVGNSDLCIGGYRYELIQRLISDGHTVFVVTPNGALINELVDMGCIFYDVPVDRHGTNPFKDMKLIRKYKKVMREISPDYVFTYTIKPNLYVALACKRMGIPCIPNVTGLGTAVENKGWKQVVTTTLYKMAFKHVKTIFFQNTENMKIW